MECRFCNLKRSRTSGSYWWGKQGEQIDKFYIDLRCKITKDGEEYDEGEILLNCINDEYEQCLTINYCPICGRKLGG